MDKLVTVLYSQISIFNPSQSDFNLWNDNHVAQGFSWRDGHVSFGIPDHDGECLVETRCVDTFPPLEDKALRAIRVPFFAEETPFIATIVDEFKTDIPSGNYEIEFRLYPGDVEQEQHPHAYRICFLFKISMEKEFLILRKSGEMTSDKVLSTDTKPAI